MLKFYKEFIFGIIESTNMRISTSCHFDDQKREYDVIFMHSTRLYAIKNSASRIVISTICKMHHYHIVIQNNIIFSFLIIKVTRCWNSHVDRLNNTKYKFLVKLQHVFGKIETKLVTFFDFGVGGDFKFWLPFCGLRQVCFVLD